MNISKLGPDMWQTFAGFAPLTWNRILDVHKHFLADVHWGIGPMWLVLHLIYDPIHIHAFASVLPTVSISLCLTVSANCALSCFTCMYLPSGPLFCSNCCIARVGHCSVHITVLPKCAIVPLALLYRLSGPSFRLHYCIARVGHCFVCITVSPKRATVYFVFCYVVLHEYQYCIIELHECENIQATLQYIQHDKTKSMPSPPLYIHMNPATSRLGHPLLESLHHGDEDMISL